MIDVVDVPGASRFEARVDGAAAGRVEYELEDGLVVLVHTEVDPAFEGRGVASEMAAGVFDELRARGAQAALRCPFLSRWVDRHPEVHDLVAGR